MESLENKVVLITGAGAGIGRVAAQSFCKQGAKVVLLSRTKKSVDDTADLVRELGGDVMVIVGDVADASHCEHAVSTAIKTYGKLDFAFNNAGIEGQFGALATLQESTCDETLMVNVKGVWLSMKYQISAMLDSGGGVIVNMSSNLSTTGIPGGSLYVASKAAVDSLTRCAAMDYARQNIRINAVAPGIVENTSMTLRLWTEQQQQVNRESSPTGRLSTPEDIVESVMWLCSDNASHINGQILNVDGGVVNR